MTIELKPELERMIQERISSGQFKTFDDVLTQALAGLPEADDQIGRLFCGCWNFPEGAL